LPPSHVLRVTLPFFLWFGYDAAAADDDQRGAPRRVRDAREAIGETSGQSSASLDSVLALVRVGDRDAFKTVYETYMTDLWHFARRYVPDDIAEDVVHDVMADLWRRREVLDIRGTVAQYLFGAVHRNALKHRRHARVVDAVERRSGIGVPPGMGVPPDAPDDVVVGHDLETALTHALARLSSTQRSVLELRWLHRMKHEQIAEILGISVDAVWQQASRAQRVVRPLLKRFLGET
jgi:RNA polymerase sigma factor (sigma-70 family)